MKKETKYWIEFFAPGIIVAESWTRDCKESTKPEDVEWPENAYCFKMWKRTDVIEDEKTFKGERERIGLEYYHPDSKIEGLDEVKKNPENKILASNMQSNKWDSIIWSRWGNFPQPFKKGEAKIIGQ